MNCNYSFSFSEHNVRAQPQANSGAVSLSAAATGYAKSIQMA